MFYHVFDLIFVRNYNRTGSRVYYVFTAHTLHNEYSYRIGIAIWLVGEFLVFVRFHYTDCFLTSFRNGNEAMLIYKIIHWKLWEQSKHFQIFHVTKHQCQIMSSLIHNATNDNSFCWMLRLMLNSNCLATYFVCSQQAENKTNLL